MNEKSIKRSLIIGDVHGCYDELIELLGKDSLNYNPVNDHLIFVGDVINKGPRSREVLELIESIPCTVIKGNHEIGFLNYLENRNGKCEDFEKLIRRFGSELKRFTDLIKSWPLYYEADDFIVVHGGIVEDVHPKFQSPSITTRIRTWDGVGKDLNNENNPAWFHLYKGKKLVIFGHWAALGLCIRDKVIGLDSGCVWGGALTGLVLPEKSFHQVKAKNVYREIATKC